jgi:hypothetical protein
MGMALGHTNALIVTTTSAIFFVPLSSYANKFRNGSSSFDQDFDQEVDQAFG